MGVGVAAGGGGFGGGGWSWISGVFEHDVQNLVIGSYLALPVHPTWVETLRSGLVRLLKSIITRIAS